ncbi:ATP-binding protein [Pseudomonas protegens]
MKVIYSGQEYKKRASTLEKEDNIILLVGSYWDDFDFKTTFKTYTKISNSLVELGEIQILIEGAMTSYAHLEKLLKSGWSGEFPIPETIYTSTPAALSFYEQIDAHTDIQTAISVAILLKDASYQTRIKEDEETLRLCQSPGFRMSLQREQGAKKAFLDAWKFFEKKNISIGNQTFRFQSSDNELSILELKFTGDSPLPHEINVLIGPNGVGKSQVLHQIINDWLRLDPSIESELGFTERPNLNQMVLISYSPFEHFPVDTHDDKNRKDHGVYRYFGLRGRKRVLNDSRRGSGNIIVSDEFPKTNAAQSLIDCLEFDKKYVAMTDWARKLSTMEYVLQTAFDFDEVAVAVREADNNSLFSIDTPNYNKKIVELVISDEDDEIRKEVYIPISSDQIGYLNPVEIRRYMHDRSGVVFLKNGTPIKLSSGQKLFSYLVINILGAIRRNSLILIDEPELFLHPALEISFIRMLKSILTNYASKALLATHSLVTVREVPRECVHVFEKTKQGLFIKQPPFETFGGDVQRISSYVFDDKSLSKPHETWIRKKLSAYGSAKALISALGKDINEELIIQIHAMEAGKW